MLPQENFNLEYEIMDLGKNSRVFAQLVIAKVVALCVCNVGTSREEFSIEVHHGALFWSSKELCG